LNTVGIISGGKATGDEYFSAFVPGFTIGSIIGGGLRFGVTSSEATLGKASLSEAAAVGASREAPNVVSAEARLVRGTFRGVDTEGYVIEGRFVPRIEGGSGSVVSDELDFAWRLSGGAKNLEGEIRVGGQTLHPDYLDESIIGETTRGGLSQRKMFQITRYMEYAQETGRTVVLEFQADLSVQEMAWVSSKAMQYEVTTWTMLPRGLVLA